MLAQGYAIHPVNTTPQIMEALTGSFLLKTLEVGSSTHVYLTSSHINLTSPVMIKPLQ